MPVRFVHYDAELPPRLAGDGEEQRPPYAARPDFQIGPVEWCPFLTCQQDGPHAHDDCWLCEALRAGNAFCGACRARWEPSPSICALRLLDRLN
jgi:hypothetical protein